MEIKEINAFGEMFTAGQPARINFTSNFEPTPYNSKAVYVLEFILRNNRVTVRPAGASKADGLILSAYGRQQQLRIGMIYDLMTNSNAIIECPGKAASLSFKVCTSDGRTQFRLNWSANIGKVVSTALASNQQNKEGHFQELNGFSKLLQKAKRISVDGDKGLYIPLFSTEEQALKFGRYITGFVKRMVPSAKNEVKTIWSQKHFSYIPVLSIRFVSSGKSILSAHWREEGQIVCCGEQMVGLSLNRTDTAGKAVLLEVKPLKTVAWTQSGSVYVSFQDGTTFHRSESKGPQSPGKLLLFTKSETRAVAVMKLGGELSVSAQPTLGLHPVLVRGELPTITAQADVVHFNKDSISCIGTEIVTLWNATVQTI
jgi:hypothetical protein